MTKRRVQLYGKQGFADVDPSATDGATVGSNLYWSDGTLVSESLLSAALKAALPAPPPGGAGSEMAATLWNFILQVPANVRALENAAGTGLFAVTGPSAGAFRTITGPAAGLTVTNGSGVGGNPTFALANDLAALEGLGSTGIAVRTAADAWAQRAITGTANRIAITNGDGVAGSPTADIAATYVGQTSITTLGTIATGTWQGTAVGLAYGGTGANYSSVAQNRVWASPDGSAGAPTFRALVAADIPSLSSIYQPLDATLTALSGANWALDALPIGSGADTVAQVSFAANTFPAKASTGALVAKTITDFALTLMDDADASAARTTLGAEATITAGTTAQFWRGDKAFTDTLLGPFGINAAPATGAQIGVTSNGSGTNQYGLHVANLTGATNNFGVHLNVAAAANAWNVYANGTANNYFAGAVGIGSTSLVDHSLRVGRALTGATTAFGISHLGAVQSDVTSAALYVYTAVSTQAAAFTLTNLRHFQATQGTIGSGSTVTNQHCFFVDASCTGATNNFGFFSNIAAATGRWNFYANGTARNYMAGSLGMGSTTDVPSALLYMTSTTQGFRPPAMTTAQRDAISTPAAGLVIYNTSTNKLNVYTTAWEAVTSV